MARWHIASWQWTRRRCSRGRKQSGGVGGGREREMWTLNHETSCEFVFLHSRAWRAIPSSLLHIRIAYENLDGGYSDIYTHTHTHTHTVIWTASPPLFFNLLISISLPPLCIEENAYVFSIESYHSPTPGPRLPRRHKRAARPLSWSKLATPSRMRMCVKPISWSRRACAAIGVIILYLQTKRDFYKRYLYTIKQKENSNYRNTPRQGNESDIYIYIEREREREWVKERKKERKRERKRVRERERESSRGWIPAWAALIRLPCSWRVGRLCLWYQSGHIQETRAL